LHWAYGGVTIVRRFVRVISRLLLAEFRARSQTVIEIGRRAREVASVSRQTPTPLRYRKIPMAVTAAISAATVLPGLSRAQSFEGLGFLPGYDYSEASGVSADGSVVVGNIRPTGHESDGPSQSFRWSASTGLVGLGFLPGDDMSRALGVNANGSVVLGYSTLLGGGTGVTTFRWTSPTGMAAIGGITGGNGVAVDADGSVVVGVSSSLSIAPQAIRWTSSTGMVGLGFPPGATASAATGVSGDGSVVVGTAFSASGAPEAFRWTTSTGAVGLGLLPSAISSFAGGVSGDGSVVVGGAQRFGDVKDEAFRWSASTGMVGLGFLPGDSFSQANAVNSNGSVVVGAGGVAGTSIYRAFRWNAATGMQSVQDILAADGVSLAGWQNMIAFGVSADGTVIAGTGTNPQRNTEAWLARIPVNAFALLDLVGVDHPLGSLFGAGQSPTAVQMPQRCGWEATTPPLRS
jgi:probable HAF family extracellular repeat protein